MYIKQAKVARFSMGCIAIMPWVGHRFGAIEDRA
jgi:hypothetical protein